MVQMVSRPTEKRSCSRLMDAIGVPSNPRIGLTDLELVVLRILEQIELKMLLIDETQSTLASTLRDVEPLAIYQQ